MLISLGTYDILFNPQPTPEAPQTPNSTQAPQTSVSASTPASTSISPPPRPPTPVGGVKTTPANSNMDLTKSDFELKVIGSKITLKG